MSTRSLADAHVSIQEPMRLARGSYKRAVDAHYTAVDKELERTLTAAEIARLRRGLAFLGEIKQPLEKP